MVGKPCTIMATLEDIEVYESLNFASVVSYDEDALKGYIRNLKDRIEWIEKALEQSHYLYYII